MATPWNNWYHVTGCTYGSWLRGDPRGWRARHHREHVEGDYNSPPPKGSYTRLYEHSKRLMTRPAVLLTHDARRVACDTMLAAFAHHEIDVAAIAVDDRHYHILARFPDREPRKWVGVAKKESARALSAAGLAAPGGVWAVRSRALPITDRAHQIAAARYILRHAEHGAAVWRCFPDPCIPNPSPR